MDITVWLAAVDQHPDTLEDHLIVGAALTLGGATRPEEVDELDTYTAADRFEELESLGFLTPVVSTDHAEGVEYILELTLP